MDSHDKGKGDENNRLIVAVMLKLCLDRSGAMVSKFGYRAITPKLRFIDGLADVPPWESSVDTIVKEYLDGIATWDRANHYWSLRV